MDASSSKRIEIEIEDKILSLPRSIVDVILGCMPTRDQVRTSILSRGWRFIWAENPVLVIDKKFCSRLRRRQSNFDGQQHLVHSVHKLLLQHKGPILKFVLEVPKLYWTEYYNLDLWLQFVSRQGLEDLTLNNLSSVPYGVPSCIFSCPTLKVLTISKCIFKAPATGEGLSFPKLTRLNLNHVTIELSVLNTPELVSLRIDNCQGVHHLNIIAPRLSHLYLLQNDHLDLSSYMNHGNLYILHVALSNGVVYNRHNERITLRKICSCWPKLRSLILDTSFLKYIIPADNVQDKLPTEQMNNLNHFAIVGTSYDFEEISRIVNLIGAFPYVPSMLISGIGVTQGDGDIKAVEYLEGPSLLKQRIHGLRVVRMLHFGGLRAELLLVKLLLGNSPSLGRILIKVKRNLDTTRRLETSKQLMRFSRASAKAEILLQ